MKFYKTTFFDSLYRLDIEIIITGYEKDTFKSHLRKIVKKIKNTE